MAEEVEEEENSLDLFKFLVEGILMVTIGSMGLLGNLLCILIFSRERAQKSFHHLMVFLAIFDLLYIIMALLLFGLPEIYNGYSLFSFSSSQVPFTKSLSLSLWLQIYSCMQACHCPPQQEITLSRHFQS